MTDGAGGAIYTDAQPYWSQREGVAPVKADFVLWDRIPASWRDVVRPHGVADRVHATAEPTVLPAPPELDNDDAAEGRTGPSKIVQHKSDLTRSTEEPPHKRQKGANKNRQFSRVQDEGIKLCHYTATGQDCLRKQQGLECHLAHDLQAYLASNSEKDIRLDRPDFADPISQSCILFDSLGYCPFGFRCRFSDSHTVKEDGEGFQETGLTLRTDENRLRGLVPAHLRDASASTLLLWAVETRGEQNVVNQSTINAIRKHKTDNLPITRAYLESIGEMLDTRPGMQARAYGKCAKHKKPKTEPSSNIDKYSTGSVEADAGKDSAETPLKYAEKVRLRFEGGLYLAPLTTVGNLPFRRLCVEYGADITCGEMGLAHEYMIGNKSEWSLVRRHPSERIFGVQLCGSRPQTLVASTEILVRECPDLDFIDVNLGCPIDLVVKKGAGSALLDQTTRLGKILKGMNCASGSVPVTIKMRTGIRTGYNTTHKLMPKAIQDWGVGAVTIHGRTQQQRYSKTADYDYIKTCVDALRSTADELDLPTIPIFGNGDAYDHRSYWQNVEETGVDGIMVARGALVKPWIFTELKERRDWDISARERLDMIGKLARHGLEHWGTDNQGINTTRRFLCEAISFTYRYVPVGLLERLPARMNERPYPFKGRDELETLLASDNSDDWVKISSMFLGPPPADFKFTPKHKSNAYGSTNESNG